MTSTFAHPTRGSVNPTAGAWRLDSTRSHLEFHVRGMWGLMLVKGAFDRFRGSLHLQSNPAAQLIVEAASLRTGIARRDEHLRSADFFDVERNPQVQFISDDVRLGDGLLEIRGELHAAGRRVPLDVSAGFRDIGGYLEIIAETQVDHRQLGMSTGPLGMIRAPSRLRLNGVLAPDRQSEPIDAAMTSRDPGECSR